MSGASAARDRHIRTGHRPYMVTAKYALREPTRTLTKGKISHDNAGESSARRFIIHSAGISAAAALTPALLSRSLFATLCKGRRRGRFQALRFATWVDGLCRLAF